MAWVQLHVLSWRFLKRLTKDVGAALQIEFLSQYSDKVVGRDGVVGIATTYGLYGAGIEPGRGEIFRIRPNPRAHPSSCTVGSGSFSGVKRPGLSVDHPPPPGSEVEKE